MENKKGLIITGHQRSGTSLLQSICGSHPEITLTGEFGWYMFLELPFPHHARQIMRQWFNKRNNPIHYSAYPWVRKIKGLDFGRNLLLVLRYLVYLSTLQPSQVTVQAVNQALAKLYPMRSYVGDKHPDYWFRLDSLVGHQDLSCVVIYRDLRDMVSSVLKKSRGEWKAD